MQAFNGNLTTVDPRKVVIDHSYQRPEKASLIAAISSDPRWELFGALVVFQRGEAELYYCADGQQRLRGVMASASPPSRVPAVVFSVPALEDEAAIFVRINNFRKALTPLEKHRGSVVAKEASALAVERAVKTAGFSISDSESSRAIGAPSALYHVYNTLGEQGTVQLLIALRDAWPDDKKATCAKMLRVLSNIIEERSNSDGGISRSSLAKKLAKTTPGRLFRKAEEIHFETGKPQGASLRAAFKALAKV